MIKRILLYFALLLWFVVPVTAQPTIFVENLSTDVGHSFTASVKVSDFKDIVSMQFSVNWDALLFQFDSLTVNENSMLPEYYPSNFGTTLSDQGKLTTSWFDQALAGVSIPDSTTLFTLHYQHLGVVGTSSEITITGDPTEIEVSDVNSNILEVAVESGTVTVLEAMGINDLGIQSNEAFTLFQNEPNPFDNQTVIRFDVREPSDFILEVYDTKGTLIHSEQAHYLKGNQTITLQEEVLPTVGAYFYKLKTKDYFITNRMILVRK